MLEEKINSDGEVEISIGNESICLSAQELDRQIERLARIRSQMKEKVPSEPPRIESVVINPQYTIRTDNVTKASLLRIRHSGLGWLNFEIPSYEALNMKHLWKAIADKLDLDAYPEFYESSAQPDFKPH